MNSSSTIHIKRITLDEALLKIKSALLQRPKKGWIAEIRTVLGMRSAQLAKRLGVEQSAVSHLEASERQGTITLQSLEKAAHALNCTLYYAFIPNQSMEELLVTRAEKVVTREHHAVTTTMALEAQPIGELSPLRRTALVAKLVDRLDKSIWDED